LSVEDEELVGALASVGSDQEFDQEALGLAAYRCAARCGERSVRVGGATPGALVEVEVDLDTGFVEDAGDEVGFGPRCGVAFGPDRRRGGEGPRPRWRFVADRPCVTLSARVTRG